MMEGNKKEGSNASGKSKEEIQAERKAKKAEKAAKKSGSSASTSKKNYQFDNFFPFTNIYLQFTTDVSKNPDAKNMKPKVEDLSTGDSQPKSGPVRESNLNMLTCI